MARSRSRRPARRVRRGGNKETIGRQSASYVVPPMDWGMPRPRWPTAHEEVFDVIPASRRAIVTGRQTWSSTAAANAPSIFDRRAEAGGPIDTGEIVEMLRGRGRPRRSARKRRARRAGVKRKRSKGRRR